MTRPSSMKSGPFGMAEALDRSSAATPSSAKKRTLCSSSEQSPESMPAHSRNSIFLGLLLIGVGIILGLVVASDLGWLPTGHAVPEAPSAPKPVALPLPPTDGADHNFVEVAKVVTPAVVNIATTRINRLPEGHSFGPFDDPFFRRFFGEEFFRRRFEAPPDHRERSLGSGVIADPRGSIITNNHVVSKADEIRVLLSDKRERQDKEVVPDTKTDLY